MGEPPRNEQLQPVPFRQRHCYRLPESRRSSADVDCHIDNLPLENLDKLGLRMRVLVMQPAQGIPAGRGEIILAELFLDAQFLVSGAVIRFHEESARVLIQLGLDYEDTGDVRF